MDINKVIVIGRLTQTCGETQTSFGYLQNGTCKANITIAVNRNRKNGDEWIQETSYFDVTIWGKTAENLKPYLTKGKQIAVEGYLKQDRWEKEDRKNPFPSDEALCKYSLHQQKKCLLILHQKFFVRFSVYVLSVPAYYSLFFTLH